MLYILNYSCDYLANRYFEWPNQHRTCSKEKLTRPIKIHSNNNNANGAECNLMLQRIGIVLLKSIIHNMMIECISCFENFAGLGLVSNLPQVLANSSSPVALSYILLPFLPCETAKLSRLGGGDYNPYPR